MAPVTRLCCSAVGIHAAQRYHGLPSGTMDFPAEPGAAQQRQGPPSNNQGPPSNNQGPPSNNQGPPSNARGRTATPGAAQQRQGPHSNVRGRTATPGPHTTPGAIQQYQAPFGSMNLVRNDLLTTLGIGGQLASTVGLVSVCGAAHLNI